MKMMINMRDWAVSQAFMAVILFLLIPVVNFIGPSNHKWVSVLHGLGASITVLLSCRVLHLLYPLLRGKEGTAIRLELYLWLTNALVLLSIIFGNWLYMGYRAPDGAQQWLLLNEPSVHLIGMEFKEFISLFPLPLGVGAAFLLRRYRQLVETHTEAASIVALLVTLSWICLLIGMAFGLGLAKIKMV